MRFRAAGLVWFAASALAGIVRIQDLPEPDSTGLEAPLSLTPEHPDAIEAARFAVEELRLLSDSGIYETLSLAKIHYAATQEGIFHNNTFLTLELASPHLLDAASSLHDVIVMADLDDGVRSFAIDEFPVMDEDAIEEFWIRKVEQHKTTRDRVFAQLEAEAQREEDEREAELNHDSGHVELRGHSALERKRASTILGGAGADPQLVQSHDRLKHTRDEL